MCLSEDKIGSVRGNESKVHGVDRSARGASCGQRVMGCSGMNGRGSSEPMLERIQPELCPEILQLCLGGCCDLPVRTLEE